ncbi:MAG: hypothetical protein XD84_1889 [Desulfotomaculum sp. 46_80]|nr:MAG: hypothetical protein XD84_1889 [Desulfotomaculum sp. 46_80]
MGETSAGVNKAPKKWLAWGVIALVLIIAVSWYLSLDKGGLKEGTVIIKEGDVILGSFTVADLKKLPAAEKKITITRNCSSSCSSKNSGGSNQSKHDYTGTPLSAVLDSINPYLTQKYKKVITRGIDYYSQVMEMSEVQQAGMLSNITGTMMVNFVYYRFPIIPLIFSLSVASLSGGLGGLVAFKIAQKIWKFQKREDEHC